MFLCQKLLGTTKPTICSIPFMLLGMFAFFIKFVHAPTLLAESKQHKGKENEALLFWCFCHAGSYKTSHSVNV